MKDNEKQPDDFFSELSPEINTGVERGADGAAEMKEINAEVAAVDLVRVWDDQNYGALPKEFVDSFNGPDTEIVPEFEKGFDDAVRVKEIDSKIDRVESWEAKDIDQEGKIERRLAELRAERQRLMYGEVGLHVEHGNGSVNEALREYAKEMVREKGIDPDKKIPGWKKLKEKTGYTRPYISQLCQQVLGYGVHKRDDKDKMSDVYLYEYEIEMIRIHQADK